MRFQIVILFLTLSCVSLRAETEAVGQLTFEVPKGFAVELKHEKDSAGELESNRWRASDGRTLEVLYLAKSPKLDRGQMVIAKKETVEVLGQKADLAEANIFFGEPRKVLVIYLRFDEAIYIVDSEPVTKPEFKAFLKTFRRPHDKP